MARLSHYVTVASAIFIVGCQPHPLYDPLEPTPRPIVGAIKSYHAPNKPGVDRDSVVPELQNPAGELTLRDALSAALLGNPELAYFSYEVRAAEARIVQAGTAENTELDFEVENFAGSGELRDFDGAEFTLALSQSFPLGGDIASRQQAARLAGQSAGWDYESARIALLAETTKRYVALVAVQQRVELARDSLDLAQEIADVIQRRIDAGDLAIVELSRAAVPLAEAKIELARARRTLETARVQLALIWGGTTPAFTEAKGDLNQLQPLPSLDDLAHLINQNPDVARWVVEVASRQAEIELARAEAIPDITGSLGYRWFNESNDGALVAGLSIPLPINDRNQGNILAARFGVASAKNRQQAVRMRIEAALLLTYSQLINAYEEAIALRDDAIPAAVNAYRDIHQAFEQGNLGYIDVLDAERTLIELQSRYLDVITDYHTAVAEVEALIGQPLFTHIRSSDDQNDNKMEPLQVEDE